MCFVGEPLDAFAKCVHVRILEYIDGHDDLVVSGHRVAHVVAKKKDGFLTTDARWPDVSARYRNPLGVRSGLRGWCHRCICKPSGCPQSNTRWLERAHLCHGQIPVLLHNVVKPDKSHGNHPIFDRRRIRVEREYLQLYRVEVVYWDRRLGVGVQIFVELLQDGMYFEGCLWRRQKR
jgi:hypothetical protein